MQREIIKWIQSLDLSSPLKNPKRDLVNGILAAEIVTRYSKNNTSILSMHSIVDGESKETCRHNWSLVLSGLQKLGCTTITAPLIESVILKNHNAAYVLLDYLYEFFTQKELSRRSVEPKRDGCVYRSEEEMNRTGVLLGVGPSDSGAPAEAKVVQAHLGTLKNSEYASGVKGLEETSSYARPTASALVREAEPFKSVSLAHEKYEDDRQRVVMTNDEILLQHRVANQLYRGMSKEMRQQSLSLTSVLRGPYAKHFSSHRVRSERAKRNFHANNSPNASGTNGSGLASQGAREAKKIEVKMFHPGGDGTFNQAGNHQVLNGENANRNVFVSTNYNVKKALFFLLNDLVKEDETEQNFCDILFYVFSSQDIISMSTMREVWQILEESCPSIAEAVVRREVEYDQLLRSFEFMFNADAARIPLLHVTLVDEESVFLGSTANSRKSASVPKRSASVSDALMNHERSPEKNTSTNPNTVLISRTALLQASAFLFFSHLHMEIVKKNAVCMSRVLNKFLVASMLHLIPFGTAATIEGVARVIVSSFLPLVERGGGNEESWLSQMFSLFDHIQRQSLKEGNSAESLCFNARLKFQLNLLIYHCSVEVYQDMSANAGEKRRSAGRGVLSAVETSREENIFAALSSHVALLVRDSFVQSHFACITLGFAGLIQLINMDQWVLLLDIIRQFDCLKMHLPLENESVSWELRIMKTEVLTLLCRKLAIFQTNGVYTKNAVQGDAKDELPSEGNSTTEEDIFSFFRLDELDAELSRCLHSFARAPLLEKQLSLNLVASRLSPSHQPRTAATFVEVLISIDFNLYSSILTPLTAVGGLEECLTASQSDSEDLESYLQKFELTQCGVDDDALPSSRTVAVLSGRVESIYAVVPLNQRWDVCGVVFTFLENKIRFSDMQTFLLVAAALMGTQDVAESAKLHLHLDESTERECSGEAMSRSARFSDWLSSAREAAKVDDDATRKCFWQSVLKRIREEIGEAVSGNSTVNNAETADEEYRKLALSILLCIFTRCGGGELKSLSPHCSLEELTEKALLWSNHL